MIRTKNDIKYGRIKLDSITVKREIDDYPDLSYLDQFKDSEEPEEQEYYKADQKRLESYGTSWVMLGISANAVIHIPIGKKTVTIQHISSSGLWGIESDSDKSYFKEIEQEQIKELIGYLKALNVDIKGYNKKITYKK